MTSDDIEKCEHGEDPSTCEQCIDGTLTYDGDALLDQVTVSAPSTTMEDADLDTMVERASRPSLATLFQQGKQRGLIGSVTVYNEGA